jgi:hypothetical protein
LSLSNQSPAKLFASDTIQQESSASFGLLSARFDTLRSVATVEATERESQASGCGSRVRSHVPGEGDVAEGDNGDVIKDAWRAGMPSKEVLRMSYAVVVVTPQMAEEYAGYRDI